MAEQQAIQVETGKNIAALLEFQNRLQGVTLSGYPRALAQALIPLGYVPGARENVPGHLDDFAIALQSDNPILLRQNVKGQTVHSRWYEYKADRQDIVTGVIGDYFLGPLLDIANGFLAGYYLDTEKELRGKKGFLTKLEEKYPIDPRWYSESYTQEVEKKEKEGIGVKFIKKLGRLDYDHEIQSVLLGYSNQASGNTNLDIDVLKDEIGPLLPHGYVRGSELQRRGRNAGAAVHEYLFERRVTGD